MKDGERGTVYYFAYVCVVICNTLIPQYFNRSPNLRIYVHSEQLDSVQIASVLVVVSVQIKLKACKSNG